MILYRSQRDHDEYLWLGIFSLNFALYDIIGVAILSGWLPITRAVIVLVNYAGRLGMVTQIEFAMRFTPYRPPLAHPDRPGGHTDFGSAR